MTIEELLNTMQNKYKENKTEGARNLENTKETWKRIQEKDAFSEFGFASTSEKDEFLKEWISEHPYSNI